MKYAGKTYFWREGKLELPLPCANSYEQSQLQPKSLYCCQSWKNSFTYAKYMWKMCVRIAMRYLCSIHIIDAYSSTTTRNMQVHQCIGGLYIEWLGGGKLIKKNLPFLGHLSPKVYTHYVCFPSFLFPGDLHDSLDILLATFGNLPSGRGYVHKRAMRGGRPKEKTHVFFLGHLSL